MSRCSPMVLLFLKLSFMWSNYCYFLSNIGLFWRKQLPPWTGKHFFVSHWHRLDKQAWLSFATFAQKQLNIELSHRNRYNALHKVYLAFYWISLFTFLLYLFINICWLYWKQNFICSQNCSFRSLLTLKK